MAASDQETSAATTEAAPPIPTPPSAKPPSHLQLRSVLDWFGLSRLYLIKPSSIPDSARVVFKEGATLTSTPTLRERQRLKDILKPYPSLSTFLFNHQFWTSSGSKSRNNRNALWNIIIREDFDTSDLKGVNFEKIEKNLQQTGGTGWCETPLTIHIPKGIKVTKASKRAATTKQSRLCRGEPSTATLERPVPGAPITIRDFQHQMFCNIIHKTFTSDPTAHSFHYHPYIRKHGG